MPPPGLEEDDLLDDPPPGDMFDMESREDDNEETESVKLTRLSAAGPGAEQCKVRSPGYKEDSVRTHVSQLCRPFRDNEAVERMLSPSLVSKKIDQCEAFSQAGDNFAKDHDHELNFVTNDINLQAMGSCYSYFTPKNVNLNQTSKTIKYLYFLFQTFPPPFNNIPPKFSTFTLISHTSIISYALFLRFMITMLI